jgi:hypothetical protein
VRCAVCANPVGYGALTLSLIHDDWQTVTVCTRCRGQLLGREVDDRVARLVRAKGWVQPQLPNM